MSKVLHHVKEFFGFVDEQPTDIKLPSPEQKQEQPGPRSMRAAASPKATAFASMEIKVMEPRVYEDSLAISSALRDSKPVILNLKYLAGDTSKRLIDFICGTAYAINGHMMRIGENIFLFTPSHILISDEIEKTTLEQGIELDEKERFFRRSA